MYDGLFRGGDGPVDWRTKGAVTPVKNQVGLCLLKGAAHAHAHAHAHVHGTLYTPLAQYA